VAQGTQRPLTKLTSIAAALLGFAALLTALLALSAPLAHADTTGFTAQPLPGSPNATLGFFKFNAAAGTTVPRTLLLTNHTGKAKVIRLAACDGLAAVFGGVAYSDSNKQPHAVGSWIQLLPRTGVAVPPNSSIEVPFEVKVPTDVTSGVHLGGIALWEPAAATTSNSGTGGGNKATTKIIMVTRMVLTVLVTTPGPAVPELAISGVRTEARPDGMYTLVAIANDGTAPASGQGTISIPSEGFQQPITLGDMIPQSSTGYPVKWMTDPTKGTYQAQVEIRYANGTKVATWSGNFTVGQAAIKTLANRLVVATTTHKRPWLMYGLIGVLLLVVVIMGFALLRRRRPASSS
jgi:hypothetical protein